MPLAAVLRHRPDADALVVAGAIALAMALGGSGSLLPAPEMVLEVMLAGMVAIWGWFIPIGRLRSLPRELWLCAGLIVALPVLQLVPLPPSVWQGLPGRQVEVSALSLIGQQNSWRPLSMVPDRTVASLLAMAATAVLLVMVAALRQNGRTLVLATIVVMGLISLVLGMAQITGHFLQFYVPDSSYLSGFQANHNSEADVLLLAIVATAAVARDLVVSPRRHVSKRVILGVAGVVMALLTLGVVLTASRTGTALLVVALSAALVIMRPLSTLSWRNTFIMIGAALALALAVVAGLWDNPVIGRTVQRFNTMQDARPGIWQASSLAARTHLPWGAGMGSFTPVFAQVERLELIDYFTTNRVHNDYLELLIEAGLMGVVWGAAILAVLALAVWHALLQGQRISRGQLICAISGLCLIAAHSLLDYPLRSISLSGLAAVAAGFLFLPGSPGQRSEWKEQP